MGHDKHITHYAILFVGLLLFVGFLMLFRFNKSVQLLVGLFGAVFYISWGIIHHALEDRLTKEVVKEYLLFGALSFLMLLFAFSV